MCFGIPSGVLSSLQYFFVELFQQFVCSSVLRLLCCSLCFWLNTEDVCFGPLTTISLATVCYPATILYFVICIYYSAYIWVTHLWVLKIYTENQCWLEPHLKKSGDSTFPSESRSHFIALRTPIHCILRHSRSSVSNFSTQTYTAATSQ